MRHRLTTLHLTILVALLVPACAVPDHADGPGVPGRSASLASVETPPGLEDETLQPKSGAALETALMTLDQVLAELPSPGYLGPVEVGDVDDAVETAGDGDEAEVGTEPEPRDAVSDEPPLAAQHAFLAGLEAWYARRAFDSVRQFKAAERLAPNSPQVQRMLGKVYTRTGNRVRGAVHLKKAVALDPDDVDSLFQIGRFAAGQGRWAEAVTTLARAVAVDQPDADPALRPVAQYYLGSALARLGYEAASIAQLTTYLEQTPQLNRTTRMVRELIVLGQQRGSTWMAVGDAYNRLGAPDQALPAYLNATTTMDGLEDGLAHRLIYTHLRLGQRGHALRAAVAYFRQGHADAESLRLVGYLTRHGARKAALVKTLYQLYEDDPSSSALVLTLAEIAPAKRSAALLESHLERRPSDRAVFERLVATWFGDDHPEAGTTAGARQAVLATVGVLEKSTLR